MAEPIVRQSGIHNMQFGHNVTLIEPVNLYGSQIGDDAFIGPFVEIQKNVVIGKRTKVQSHTFICEFAELCSNGTSKAAHL